MNAYEMLLLVAVVVVIAVDFYRGIKKMRESDFIYMVLAIVFIALAFAI